MTYVSFVCDQEQITLIGHQTEAFRFQCMFLIKVSIVRENEFSSSISDLNSRQRIQIFERSKS